MQKTLTTIRDKTNLPIIGELLYKCKKKFGQILDADTGNEEISVHDFLSNEVDPVLDYFRRTDTATVSVIDRYYEAVNETNGMASQTGGNWSNRWT